MTGTADPGGIGRLRPGPLARIGHDPDALEAFYTEHVTAIFDPRTFRPLGRNSINRAVAYREALAVPATVVDQAGQRP